MDNDIFEPKDLLMRTSTAVDATLICWRSAMRKPCSSRDGKHQGGETSLGMKRGMHLHQAVFALLAVASHQRRAGG